MDVFPLFLFTINHEENFFIPTLFCELDLNTPFRLKPIPWLSVGSFSFLFRKDLCCDFSESSVYLSLCKVIVFFLFIQL